MADNEIVKALKVVRDWGREPTEFLLDNAIDLINRQKAELDKYAQEQHSEIKTLKGSNVNLQELYYTEREKVKTAKQKCIDIAKALKTAKAEIERLEDLNKCYYTSCQQIAKSDHEIKAEAYKEFAEAVTKAIQKIYPTATGNLDATAVYRAISDASVDLIRGDNNA